MALLDTFHLLLVFLTGRYVCPTVTVILVQFTLPLSAFLTQFVHSDGRCSCHNASSDDSVANNDEENTRNELQRFGSCNDQRSASVRSSRSEGDVPMEGTPLPGWGGLSAEHLWGSLILTLAVVLALLPSFYSIINPSFFIYADELPIQTAYNTLLYASSCFPAAASQLYKEHVFLQNKQPVNANYLNFLLSLFQFILASVMTPLVFGLQGLGASDDWTSLYPSSHFSNNFLSGLKCFFGMLSEDSAKNEFPEIATCHFSLLLVLVHAFSIIAVGCAVDKIINAGATKAMYRGISAGIIIAVIIMYEYDMHIPQFNYGPEIDLLNLICLILLVVGAEVYHRVSLSDSVFTTEYPTVDGLYEDEE
jgi:CRT-like, chloroquine-resistance transporter-like